MAAADEDALYCDFAETYHILDPWTLPPPAAARLAAGLRPDSRVVMRMAGTTVPLTERLLAIAADALQWLVWTRTEDARHNRNRPPSLLEALNKKPQPEDRTFDSGEAFRRAWAQRTEKGATDNAGPRQSICTDRPLGGGHLGENSRRAES